MRLQRSTWLFIILFAISAVLRIWYVFQPALVWWDASIYIGMGKYMFSHGTIGFWEMFRPTLWPLMLGIIWKAGLSPLFWAKIMEIIFSLGTIFLVYLIGETIKKNVGLYAAALLSFSPIFFTFTPITITDIPSTALNVLAAFMVLKKRYFWGGVFVALAFAMRFPQGLMLVPLGLFILINDTTWKARIKNGLLVLLGFVIFVSPFLISNYIAYGNFISPIITGNQVIEQSANPVAAHDLFYYVRNLFIENPFIVFALVSIGLLFLKSKKLLKNEGFLLSIISLGIIGIYFSVITHKELRYAISFLPYLAILSGYGIDYIVGKINTSEHKRALTYSAITLGVTLAIISVVLCIILYAPAMAFFGTSPSYEKYFNYFKDKKTTILTSSPQYMVFSDSKLVEIFDSWEHADRAYTAQKNNADYIAIDNCALLCENQATCDATKKNLIAKIQSQGDLILTATKGECRAAIYTIRH